jgi:hypothetical protein
VVTPFADAIAILEEHYYTPVELCLWLQSPQPMIENITPLALLAQGRADELLQVVKAMDEGVYI